MAITFDPSTKRIILDSANVSATEMYSRSADWLALSDNAKYGAVFRQVGGDDLGGGLFIPPYFFLQNTWRVRPMEANHNLTITGNLFVDGGGIPVVSTLGTFQVNVNYTVPVQAQGISTNGSTGPTAAEIAAEVLLQIEASLILAKESTVTAVGANIDSIKGTGFDTTKHNLVKIKQQASLAAALSA